MKLSRCVIAIALLAASGLASAGQEPTLSPQTSSHLVLFGELADLLHL